MKIRTLLVCVVCGLVAGTSACFADPATELNELVGQIKTKLKAGARAPEELKPEREAFDALLAKYKDDKSEDTARIALMRATFLFEVLEDEKNGKVAIEEVMATYPGSQAAQHASRTLVTLERRAKAQVAKEAVVGKSAPELNFKWSSQAGLKKLSDLKGKVVVLDFWATWCGPCIHSFPHIGEMVERYKDSDVVIVGVTSLQGRVSNLEAQPIDTTGNPDKEMALMTDFIKAKKMTWPVVFSEQEVFNADYGVTGIPHLVIIAPDGTVRHNGLHPAQSHDNKIDALLSEFKLRAPKA